MFKNFSIFILVVIALGSSATRAEQPVKNDSLLAVETADDVMLQSATGNKAVTCKIHFPKTGGPYPVILFSHGFGGNKNAFGSASQHWAGHGYVVIHPSHADGVGLARQADGRAGNAPPATRPRLGNGGLLGGLNDPQKTTSRMADLVLVLDLLDDLPNKVPGLKGKIDREKIGVGGHSFGAYSAMLIGGVTADLGGEKNKSYLDKRVKCILPISAQGTGQQGLTDKSWDHLTLPMMTITGTKDRGAGGQGLDWKKEPFERSPAGNKYLVVIEGANHVSFGGRLGLAGDIPKHVNLVTTQFWDAYLKNSAAAKEYLQGDRLTKETGGKCTLQRK